MWTPLCTNSKLVAFHGDTCTRPLSSRLEIERQNLLDWLLFQRYLPNFHGGWLSFELGESGNKWYLVFSTDIQFSSFTSAFIAHSVRHWGWKIERESDGELLAGVGDKWTADERGCSRGGVRNDESTCLGCPSLSLRIREGFLKEASSEAKS